MVAPIRTLLAPGHEARWDEINSEDAHLHRSTNLALSMSERLELGQRLSTQAVELLAAARRAGLGSRPAHPS